MLQFHGVVTNDAGVVADVGVLYSLRVDGLVSRLRVQNKAGHAARPRVRPSIFEPVTNKINISI